LGAVIIRHRFGQRGGGSDDAHLAGQRRHVAIIVFGEVGAQGVVVNYVVGLRYLQDCCPEKAGVGGHLQTGLDSLGVERGAIVELDTLADVEGDGLAVWGYIPGLGQEGLEFLVQTHPQERLHGRLNPAK
jgi:hypothetical protein